MPVKRKPQAPNLAKTAEQARVIYAHVVDLVEKAHEGLTALGSVVESLEKNLEKKLGVKPVSKARQVRKQTVKQVRSVAGKAARTATKRTSSKPAAKRSTAKRGTAKKATAKRATAKRSVRRTTAKRTTRRSA